MNPVCKNKKEADVKGEETRHRKLRESMETKIVNGIPVSESPELG